MLYALIYLLKAKGVYQHSELINPRLFWQHHSLLGLVLLHMYMYGWNVYAWQRTRINYPFIFEFSPGSELRYREVLLVCTGFTSLLLGTTIAHIIASSKEAPNYISSEFAPMGIFLVRCHMTCQWGSFSLSIWKKLKLAKSWTNDNGILENQALDLKEINQLRSHAISIIFTWYCRFQHVFYIDHEILVDIQISQLSNKKFFRQSGDLLASLLQY